VGIRSGRPALVRRLTPRRRVSSSRGRASTFASLHVRNFRLYFFGQTISASGSLMQDSALPWLVLQRTHSPFLVGALVFCRYAPLGCLSLYGGVLADRYDNRRILLVTQTTMMFVAVALAVDAGIDSSPTWLFFALAILSSLALAFDTPSKWALTYQLVGPRDLANALSLNMSLQNSARIVGPALGGVVIAAVGPSWCFAVNAASFFAVLGGLLLMRESELVSAARTAIGTSAVRALREGVAHVRASPELQILLGLAFVSGICGFSAVRTLLPILASRTLHSGPRTFGALYAAYGAGAVVGGLVSARLARLSWRRLFIGSLFFNGAMIVLAPIRVAVLAGALLFVIGLAWTTWSAQSQLIVQTRAPDALRGRLISTYNTALFVGIPFGGLFGGWLAGAGGTQLAFGAAGGVGIVAVGVAAALPHGPVRRRSIPSPALEPRGEH
jgi:MFS family permease